MNKLYYPKTYATIIAVRLKDDEWPYKPCAPVWTVKTDDGRVFEVKDPSRSGHSSPALKMAHRAAYKSLGKKYTPYCYLVGFRVKLYQRPQDGKNKWCYRHLGQ
jgi:hypothetical protein